MVRTASTMMPLGTPAPHFDLPETNGGRVSLADFKGKKAFLVIFLCNHCPYVKHVAEQLRILTDEMAPLGVGIVGISSNDIDAYRDDDFESMKREKELRRYTFPYALDEDQSVAVAYGAACTPDLFLFDERLQLTYRGQLDDSRPGNGLPVSGSDLRAAIMATLSGHTAPEPQKPAIGCNIKWKPGREPAYFNPAGIS